MGRSRDRVVVSISLVVNCSMGRVARSFLTFFVLAPTDLNDQWGLLFLHVDRKPYFVPDQIPTECELRDVIHSSLSSF